MPTLLMNKVAVNYDSIMHGSMTVQQVHQKLSKLAKQMIELPDAYLYRIKFMNVLKPDIRDQVLKKGFTPEFSSIDELVNEAVTLDNAKCYGGHGGVVAKHPLEENAPIVQFAPPPDFHTFVVLSVLAADSERRVAGARIDKVILEEDEGQIEEDEGQIEEFDEGTPHPEEQQDWEDQPEEDEQQYHFDDDKYEMRSIDNEVIHVNAVVKASGYNDRCRLYGIRVQEAEIDMRVSAVVQTGEKEQPVYDH
ncbi:hypothetical protein M422DRAFT_264002 [Sphaerobolus stellatus SS14]|uniref:Unplaced genomic scaffold SPHSTscaffold_130, whole genome shotgun sequence n=1 Tax=Sphaerobolus stellatus (strain SS14) TaxID=990650 RepID=A0A0C9V991_SPHS4|nr:hypothetical protein M422DRAFT_264002 [Sphaerobolus stellatus SS14]